MLSVGGRGSAGARLVSEGNRVGETPAKGDQTYWRIQHAKDPLSYDHRSQIGTDDENEEYGLGTEAGTSSFSSFGDLQKWARGGHANWIGDLALVEFRGDRVGKGQDGEDIVRPTEEVRRIPLTGGVGDQKVSEQIQKINPSSPNILHETPTKFNAEDEEPTTGVKNAVSAGTRQKLGMEDRVTPTVRTNKEVYEAAKALATEHPEAMAKLLEDLRRDPERIVGSQLEAGLMLHHRVTLERELVDLSDRRDQALEDGLPAVAHVANLQLADKRAQIAEFTKLAERTGTAGARSLQFRNAMSDLDFSLSHMETEWAASKGAPLDDAELKRVKKLYDELQPKIDALEKDAKEAKERAATAEADLHHVQLRFEAAGPLGERILADMAKASSDAKARIRARGLRAMAGIDPGLLADYAVVGAEELAKGIADFPAWSSEMVKTFGKEITPHLKQIFGASEKGLDKSLSAVTGKVTPKAPRIGKPKVEPQANAPKDIRAKMAARVADGATIDQLRSYLRQLALEQIRNGVTDRAAVLGAVYRAVVDAGLKVKRTEVRDALSGYGDFKPLSKDKDETALRHLRAQYQKLAQLEALKRKQAPLATGVERQAPDDETRRLQQQVNAGKKELGIGDMSEEGRLKSSLASAVTHVRNQISDLQSEIDTHERIVKNKPVRLSSP